MHKKIIFFACIFLIINFNSAFSEEENDSSVSQKIESIQKDLKTLEKAVYSSDASSTVSFSDNEDVLARHLLKLSDIEEQFKNLTNRFEEINFKIDKLSSRITKIQSDNQLRFQDLENTTKSELPLGTTNVVEKLPGSGEPTELGKISDEEVETIEQVQKTQSVESAATVITETPERSEKILPDKSPEEQYKFALSFIKVGDYETAELALREFVDANGGHKLAGNAQYWYGETFRIRQLYQDAATAYLDGYQKYPKNVKAPINLLRLGVTLVQIGEKEQGCSMISGVKDQYPKANQSVLQKAKYEEKKFECVETKS